ncbi:50S ribosomal protein L4 [Patescibacteria group bacterium]|nr:50S ribosomal protein L4 [Patescibacteria group bacterium]
MTYTIQVYNKDGKATGKLSLNEALFNDERINDDLIHEFFLLQQANARHPIAHVKTRAEVAGSGKKLFRQKGTGNARAGSSRSPIRKHGGVAFGPRNDVNHSKAMTKKMKKLALCGIFTIKAKNEQLLGLEANPLKEIKTKTAVTLLGKIGLGAKKTLIIMSEKDDVVAKSFNNIPRTKSILADYINPVDLLQYDKVVLLEGSMEKIEKIVG